MKNLKLLVFSLILPSLLFTGCEDKRSQSERINDEINKITQNAEQKVIFIMNEQMNYFHKNQSFVLFPDIKGEELKWYSTNADKCYGYYIRPGVIHNNNDVVDSVYVYADQDACGDNWGITLKLLVGAVYAVKPPGSEQIKLISILCKENDGAYLYRGNVSPPKYSNNVLTCPPKTTQVYSNVDY